MCPSFRDMGSFCSNIPDTFPIWCLKGSNGLMTFSEEAILEQELTLSSILLLEVPGPADKQWVPPADHN
jgi:hypothetical protein